MKHLPQNQGALLQEPDYFGAQSFSEQVITKFPEFSKELVSDSGLLHVQMGTLASLARLAIDSDDTPFLRRVFDFLEEILRLPRVYPEVENAVAISFLSHADFEQSEAGRRAYALLPETLKHVLQKAT